MLLIRTLYSKYLHVYFALYNKRVVFAYYGWVRAEVKKNCFLRVAIFASLVIV